MDGKSLLKWIENQIEIMEENPTEWNQGYCYGMKEVRDLLKSKSE